MKTLNITELKKINGGEVNDARRNGENRQLCKRN